MGIKLCKEMKIVTPSIVCPRCGNQYLVVWLMEGMDYNDFGDRYCPFCGLVTDLFLIPEEE